MDTLPLELLYEILLFTSNRMTHRNFRRVFPALKRLPPKCFAAAPVLTLCRCRRLKYYNDSPYCGKCCLSANATIFFPTSCDLCHHRAEISIVGAIDIFLCFTCATKCHQGTTETASADVLVPGPFVFPHGQRPAVLTPAVMYGQNVDREMLAGRDLGTRTPPWINLGAPPQWGPASLHGGPSARPVSLSR